MIVHLNNLKSGKLFGQCRGFKVYTGTRYLGTYIGDEKFKAGWIKSGKINERDTFVLSEKQRTNILRKDTLRRPV